MGLWDEYCEYAGLSSSTPHEEWAFGADPDALAELVTKGLKTGTASLYDCYVAEKEPIPEIGSYSVVLDGSGKEACVIQDYSVRVVPFFQVDHFHAYTEGEGDRSLAYWQEVHWRFFSEEAKEAGIPLSSDPMVVLEKFHVVYPKASETKLVLVQPEEENLSAVLEYKESFAGRREEMHGTAGLGRREDLVSWFQESQRVALPDYPSDEDLVRSTQLFLLDREEKKFLGAIHVRHTLNSNLLLSGGHIGYSVRPDERKKGYASKMLEMTLSYAKALGLGTVLVTCNPENLGSRKTILAAGGVLENEVFDEEEGEHFLRYWISL